MVCRIIIDQHVAERTVLRCRCSYAWAEASLAASVARSSMVFVTAKLFESGNDVTSFPRLAEVETYEVFSDLFSNGNRLWCL